MKQQAWNDIFFDAGLVRRLKTGILIRYDLSCANRRHPIAARRRVF